MSKEEKGKTPIGDFGKFGLINHLTANIRNTNKTTISGIGDDSAVIGNGRNLTLVTTDLMLEGIHFNLIYNPLKHLGYKSVIRAISDIYAMNGTPGQLLVALGLSSRFSVEDTDELYEGIRLACEKYSVDLAGGDMTSSLTGLTIGVTAIGTADRDNLVMRKGAGPNDLICVTGDFGASYMGLQVLERERKLFSRDKTDQPDLSGFEYIIGRQLKPEFPLPVLDDLRHAGIVPTSMIDVTDGLASDLMHVCKLSGTGCRIFSNKIPVDHETARVAEEFNMDPLVPALNGGEDYELLFTVPLEIYDKVETIKQVKVIGHITPMESGNYLIGEGGTEIELKARGWMKAE
jgi:thiamine-monophosphate kinase